MVHDSITTGGPLFRRIADSLADAIVRGDYPAGSRLPSEFALMRMFGASRFTIREALVDLRARGLVASRRGSGTTVLRQTPQTPKFTAISRSIDEFLATTIPLQPLEVRDVIADEALAAELRCEFGRQFLLFQGVRKSPGGPDEPLLTLTDAYIAASFSAIRPYLFELTGSIAGTAERVFGIRVRKIVEEMEPIVHDDEMAAVFDAPEGSPAMLVRRWYYLDGETILLISRSIYPKGRVLFRNELRRSEIGVSDS
ncbi:GntR family transcriptional regulator [Bradyrhizobium sp. CCGUVB23]|uniref:GntR family transcriptional regulator n=1 Tax=Bradyrhizobium sp. CCGUVB23 TaxID=2949630 RepID=UPI0020B2529F|nr:GntR family transcriptional regulator [Bradyrhizobium sp. CCGUVB23]MCP3464641.1 GntR family transcriptional regulator [Bradyrhizobium sp. CCGUVB23]